MLRAGLLALLTAVLAGACAGGQPTPSPTVSPATPSPSTSPGALRYVALGDSYTIGTSGATDARWPNQLVAALGPASPTLDLVANLGVDGFASGDVIDIELPKLDGLRPEFMTLLIGVNDVVRGVPPDAFRRNATTILDDLVARVGAGRVLVVTTPDYTVTPAGADFGNPERQAAAIRAYNDLLTGLATAQGVAVVDIYDLSLRAGADRSLVAGDGLHPSGAQYALWVERIAPAVRTLLEAAATPT